MKFKALVMTLLFAAGVVASVAVAKGPPPGKGKDKGSSTSSSSTSTSTTDSGKGKGKNKKKNGTAATTCKTTVTFVLKGEFVSGGSAAESPTPTSATPAPAGPKITGTFEMDVKQANNHGRKYVGETATISIDSKTKFKRRGHAELEDFEAGDWLNVHVRACHPKKASTGGTGTTTTPTTSTPTTTAPSEDTQAVLLAKQVVGKPGASSGDTTQTTTTSP